MKPKIQVVQSTKEVFKNIQKSGPTLIAFSLIYLLATTLLFKPVIRAIFYLFMRFKGYPILINADIASFLWSISGIAVTIVVLSITAIFIFFEFANILYILQLSEQRKKRKLLFSMEKAFFSLKTLRNKETIGFILYSVVLLPVFSFGIQSTILPEINIPNFVLGEIEKYPGGFAVLPVLFIFGTILSVRLLLVLPYMSFNQDNFFTAAKKSFKNTKGNSFRIFALMALTMFISGLIILIPSIVFSHLRGLIVLPLKAIFFLIVFSASIVLPSTMICTSLVCYRHFEGEFSIIKTDHIRRFDAKIRDVFTKIKQKILILLKKITERLKAFFYKHAPNWLQKRPYIMLILLIIPIIIIIDIIIPLQLEPRQPLVIGHRGSLDGVENTKEAIQGAIDQGADYAEIDILLSKDGVPMVIHDTNLRRLSGQKKKVYELTAQELSEIELRNEKHTGHISTLDEICKLSKDKIPLLIEFKTHGKETESVVEKSVKVVKQNRMQSQVKYQTTELDLLNEMVLGYPEIEKGYIVYGYVGKLSARKISGLGADFLVVEESFVTSSLADSAHKAGIPIYVWTVNYPEDVKDFYDLRVDGIITDYPKEIKEALDNVDLSSNQAKIALGNFFPRAIFANLY